MATTEEILLWSPAYLKARIAELERERDEAKVDMEGMSNSDERAHLMLRRRLGYKDDETTLETTEELVRKVLGANDPEAIRAEAFEQAADAVIAVAPKFGPEGPRNEYEDIEDRAFCAAVLAIRALKEKTDE